MDKETILAKSRKENRDKDLYKTEVEVQGGNLGMLAAALLATVFFVLQWVAGQGINLGLYAILCAVGAAQFIYKAIRIKRGRDRAFAIVYTLATLALTATHIATLLA